MSFSHPALSIVLLVISNIFMTFAWYGHLKHFKKSTWIIAVMVSWGIAFFEYLLQVTANRMGANHFSLAQLKIIQEVITLSVFVPFMVFYMDQPFKWNYIAAGFCLILAVLFVFYD